MMNPKLNDAYLRLSAQRALLGAISKQVVGICIVLADDTFTMTVYFEGEATYEEKDELQSAEAEIHADIYPDVPFSITVFNENAQNPLDTQGTWIFLRYGYQVTKSGKF